MQATIGDKVLVHSNAVGKPDRRGEVLEVRGSGGQPPYWVRFDDGHEALLYPGPDCVIEQSAAHS